jgi:hypothetical protein
VTRQIIAWLALRLWSSRAMAGWQEAKAAVVSLL